MNCLNCQLKSCRVTTSCGLEKFDRNNLQKDYHLSENQKVVQKAADLVDHGRAGALSRGEDRLFAHSPVKALD